MRESLLGLLLFFFCKKDCDRRMTTERPCDNYRTINENVHRTLGCLLTTDVMSQTVSSFLFLLKSTNPAPMRLRSPSLKGIQELSNIHSTEFSVHSILSYIAAIQEYQLRLTGSQAELKRKLSETSFDQAHFKYWTKLSEVSYLIIKVKRSQLSSSGDDGQGGSGISTDMKPILGEDFGVKSRLRG